MAKYLLIGLALGAGLYLRGKSAAAAVKTAPATAQGAPAKTKTAAKPAALRKAPAKPVAKPAAVVTINDVRANNMLMVTGQQAGWLPKYRPNASKNKHQQGKAVK